MRRSSLAVLLWIGCGVAMVPAATLEELELRVQRGDNNVMAELNTLLQQDPHNYAAQFLQARLLSQQGKLDGASKIYRQLIQQQPKQPEAYNNLASILVRQGDLGAAQQLLEQALNSNPSYAAVYRNLSAIYVEQARTSYGKALRLEQNSTSLTLSELQQPIVSQTSKPLTTVAVIEPVKQPDTTAAIAVVKPASNPVTVAVVQPTAATPPAPVASSPQPVVHVAVKPKAEIDQQQLITTLEGWAAAWSGKAPDLYLSFYDKTFSPPGTVRTNWEAQRRERITEPQWIKVSLSDFNVKPMQAKRARVRFVQEYQSDGYRDRIRKEVVLQNTVDGWRIVAERKIAALH